MEVIWSGFNIIATLITDILYDKALVNNLFSFDLDKKIIEIKKIKNEKRNDFIEIEDSLRIYSKKTMNFSLSNNDHIPKDQLKNGLNEDVLKNKEVNTKEIAVKDKKRKRKKERKK